MILLDFSGSTENILKTIPADRTDVSDLVRLWFNEEKTLEVKTSGTTGPPKNIFLEKSSLQASAERTNSFFQINEQSVIGNALPLRGIGGKMSLIRAIAAKCKYIVFPPSLFTDSLPENIPAIDVLSVTYPQLVSLASTESTLSVTHFLLGGVPSGDTDLLLRTFNQSIFWESFGMTESCSHFAIRNVSKGEKKFNLMNGVRVSTDEENCLILNDDVTGIHQLQTEDVIKPDELGNFEWIGRKSLVINTAGIKIYPESLEDKLRKAIPFSFAVTAVAHPIWNQSIALVFQHDYEEIPVEEIKGNILGLNLSSAEKPRYYAVVKAFKKTAGNKLDRNAFKDLKFEPF